MGLSTNSPAQIFFFVQGIWQIGHDYSVNFPSWCIIDRWFVPSLISGFNHPRSCRISQPSTVCGMYVVCVWLCISYDYISMCIYIYIVYIYIYLYYISSIHSVYIYISVCVCMIMYIVWYDMSWNFTWYHMTWNDMICMYDFIFTPCNGPGWIAATTNLTSWPAPTACPRAQWNGEIEVEPVVTTFVGEHHGDLYWSK